MDRAVAIGDRACVPALVVPRVCEADGERSHRPGGGLRHQRDDDARVDAAGEQGTERDVGNETLAYGLSDRGAHTFEPLVLARARFGGRRRPVALEPLTLALDDAGVSPVPRIS